MHRLGGPVLLCCPASRRPTPQTPFSKVGVAGWRGEAGRGQPPTDSPWHQGVVSLTHDPQSALAATNARPHPPVYSLVPAAPSPPKAALSKGRRELLFAGPHPPAPCTALNCPPSATGLGISGKNHGVLLSLAMVAGGYSQVQFRQTKCESVCVARSMLPCFCASCSNEGHHKLSPVALFEASRVLLAAGMWGGGQRTSRGAGADLAGGSAGGRRRAAQRRRADGKLRQCELILRPPSPPPSCSPWRSPGTLTTLCCGFSLHARGQHERPRCHPRAEARRRRCVLCGPPPAQHPPPKPPTRPGWRWRSCGRPALRCRVRAWITVATRTLLPVDAAGRRWDPLGAPAHLAKGDELAMQTFPPPPLRKRPWGGRTREAGDESVGT